MTQGDGSLVFKKQKLEKDFFRHFKQFLLAISMRAENQLFNFFSGRLHSH